MRGGYLRLGVEHILLGVDHLLFVLGLMLIVRRPLDAGEDHHRLHRGAQHHAGGRHARLRQRAAAAAERRHRAVSILFLGPEIVRAWRGETSFTIRHPWVVAFAFGLLHGFGFASGLTTMGLPQAEIPLALLLFNVGVEIGQLVFVLLVLLLERSFRVLEIHWPRCVQRCRATRSARSAPSGRSSAWLVLLGVMR